jgi:hypothetical protein
VHPRVGIKSYANNQRRPSEHRVRDRVFLKISSMRGVMQLEEKWEIGLQGCLTPKLDNSFSQDYTWTVYLFLFWLKG